MAVDWSREEIELIVADYLAMLMDELSGRQVHKTEHRRALMPRLNGRTEGSIEYKHQNISAVLLDNGFPAIGGYKPARNYQRGIFPEIVMSQARSNFALRQLIEQQVEQDEPVVPQVADILAVLEVAPERREQPSAEVKEHFNDSHVDYLAREARNHSLGQRGEEFVCNFEKARLIVAGRENLAERIEHTSREVGDGAGFDIRSFEANGTDRFIEVKTTRYGRYAPFYVTNNELAFSSANRKRYHLYRLFGFGRRTRLFQLSGHLDANVHLNAEVYRARL